MISTFFIWLFPFLIGKVAIDFTSSIFFIALSSFLVMISIYRVIRTVKKQEQATWIIFLVLAIFIFVGMHISSFNQLIFGDALFSSYGEIAILVGYLLGIPFSLMFVHQLKSKISKNVTISAITVSITIIIANLYCFFPLNNGEYTLTNILLLSQTTTVGIIFAPFSIGIILFIKGKTNFFPSLMFFSIIPLLIASELLQLSALDKTYYLDYIADLFYYVTFVLFIIGAYHKHLLVLKEVGVENI